jgi:hypothetical protein
MKLKKKTSEAVKEEEIQKCKKRAKVALDVDNDDAAFDDDKAVNVADEDDGFTVDVADNDDSKSESSECFDDSDDSDDDNNNDKCCACNLCCCTIGKWKAKKY